MMLEPQFDLGRVFVTPAVLDSLDDDLTLIFGLIDRHVCCDFGDLCPEDLEANQQALIFGDRLLSSYDLPDPHSLTVWVITEADRSATTVLLPSDY